MIKELKHLYRLKEKNTKPSKTKLKIIVGNYIKYAKTKALMRNQNSKTNVYNLNMKTIFDKHTDT